MKVPLRTIERADRLIDRGEMLLTTIGQVGNIDAHDVWYADVRSYLSTVAPAHVSPLGAVAKKYNESLMEVPNGRAVYNLILDQIEVLRAARDELEETDDHTSIRLGQLYSISKHNTSVGQYREELMTSLYELKICYDNDCYTAVMALSGKILEICLKATFKADGIEFGPKDMLGKLIELYEKRKSSNFPAQNVPEVGKIISQHRIGAVHLKEKADIPSKDQAVMVIHCTADVIEKTLNRTNV